MRWTLLSFLLAGCAPAPSTCVPGQVIDCPCAAGVRGAQTCGADGRYGACACLGVDAGSSGDSGPAMPDGAAEASVPDAAGDVAAADVRTCATDMDRDGFVVASCGGDDCDDADPRAHPGQPAICGPTFRNGADIDINCNRMPDFVEASRFERCAGEMNAAMRVVYPVNSSPDRPAVCLFPRGGMNAQVCVSCSGTGTTEKCACWQSFGDPIRPYRCDSSGFRL